MKKIGNLFYYGAEVQNPIIKGTNRDIVVSINISRLSLLIVGWYKTIVYVGRFKKKTC